jgi:hypothetical protein
VVDEPVDEGGGDHGVADDGVDCQLADLLA